MENVRMRCDLSHQNWGGRECLGRVRAAGQSGMRLNLVFNSYFIDRGSLYRRGPGSCDDSLRRICWIAAVDVFQKLKCQLIFKQHFFLLALWCLVVGVGRKMIQTWWQPIDSVWIFLGAVHKWRHHFLGSLTPLGAYVSLSSAFGLPLGASNWRRHLWTALNQKQSFLESSLLPLG